MGVRHARIDLHRTSAVNHRFVAAALLIEDESQVAVGLGEIGAQGYSLEVVLACLAQAPLRGQGIPRSLWATANCGSMAMARS